MPSGQLIALDLLVTAVAAATWLGAGAAAAAHQARAALAVFAAAVLATLARAGSAAALAGSGWWFVQEKVVLTLPLLGVTGLAAAWLAGPRLVRAVRPDGGRRGENPGQDDGENRAQRGVGRPVVVVPLLTAGYAATAGLLVTFLVGYPVGGSEALVTIAAVATAALVTWHVAAPGRSALRRSAAAVTVAVAVAGVGLAFVPTATVDAGAGQPVRHPVADGVPVSTLRAPESARPAPGGTVRRYTLTARTATVTLSSGRRVEAWTYNGQVPGPPITATQGDLIEVTLRNADIRRGVTVHWHGYEVPAGDDGAPGLTQQTVAPGEEFVYRFPADQVGTYWYHTHQSSDIGVRKGLYGALVVTPRSAPPVGLDLTLPVHTFGGTTVVGADDRTAERWVAPGTPVRLRLVNTDSTPHRFTLAGTRYRLVAVDGRDLHQPGPLDRHALVLAAGGRYDLAFTMPDTPVVLRVGDGRDGGLRLRPDGAATRSPTAPGRPAAAGSGSGEDTARWPDLDLTRYGAPAAMPFDADSRFDRRFTLVLDRTLTMTGGRPRYAQTVNGRAFPSTPTQVVRENDLVLMTIANRGQDIHPWHLHGHTVLVLSRNGRAPTGSPLRLDSFDVRPGEVWQVAFRANNPGVWMNHCHDLSHFRQGMAVHLAYENVTTPFHGSHD